MSRPTFWKQLLALIRRFIKRWLDGASFTGGSIRFAGLTPQAGEKNMYIVKANIPDVSFTISPPEVVDSEGNVINDDDLTYSVTSTNDAAVAIVADPGGDPLKGSVHIGAPNADGTPALASVNVTVTDENGTMMGSFGAQFTVTSGDPAGIQGGGIAFDGLTAAPEP